MARRRVTETVGPVLTASIRVLVHSNVLISLSATSLAVSTVLLAELSIDPLPLFIVFSVTMFVYSYNRIADFAEDSKNIPERASFTSRYGTSLLAVGIALYVLATALAVLQGIPAAPAMGIPLAVAVLYSVVGLKKVLLVKNLLVGLSWGLIPAGIGIYYGALWTTDVLFMAVFSTTMLTIAAAIFDIKDIEGDSEAGIDTLPVLYGPAVTRRVAVAATAVVALTVGALVWTGVLDPMYLLLEVFLAYVIGYSLVATADRGPLFYGFVVDAEHIFLAVLLALVEGVSRGAFAS
ncbi:4-hydroxybenzoate polyprenyltransferase [Halovenus aranensis]|jgi:4-hydroxybenzoate polyprenyltransferase|uniref:4-hydroxybenzoate polyprenyltransferase n=1 Tax=Halovenus aranensis TaxID=890420 RepID=A0A1G8S2A1_9EURY|nr:UbiA family prenyltransferase [Halovenus aranensis]SDJ23336.1 4-hydroxybenzoate polyprenyltransferase [Halovenus aranensis]